MAAKREQRRMIAYLDGLPPIGDRQAKVNAFPLAALGDDVRELDQAFWHYSKEMQ